MTEILDLGAYITQHTKFYVSMLLFYYVNISTNNKLHITCIIKELKEKTILDMRETQNRTITH